MLIFNFSFFLILVKEYKDLPSEEDQNNLLYSNKTRLKKDEQTDYESTTRGSQGFNGNFGF